MSTEIVDIDAMQFGLIKSKGTPGCHMDCQAYPREL